MEKDKRNVRSLSPKIQRYLLPKNNGLLVNPNAGGSGSQAAQASNSGQGSTSNPYTVPSAPQPIRDPRMSIEYINSDSGPSGSYPSQGNISFDSNSGQGAISNSDTSKRKRSR